MKYLGIIFFLSFHYCFGQYEFDYQPLISHLDEAGIEKMKYGIETRLKADIKNIQSSQQKKIKEYYVKRTNWLTEHIEEQNFIYDPTFTKYVENVLKQILASNPSVHNKPSRILIDRNPTVNALCTGEGTLIINLGLLRRIENESQLAFVIAHELAHYELNHVNSNISGKVEELYGKKTKEKVRAIRQSGQSRTLQALELLKGIMYTGMKYRREFELEADSLGQILLSNSPYDQYQAISLLNILDSADYPKYRYYPHVDSVFNFSKFPFKESWLTEEEGIFNDNINSTFIFDTDSLKTHPDIKTRIAAVTQKLNKQPQSNINLQKAETLEWIVQTSDFEAIESAYFLEDYGRCLFLTLQGLSAYQDHSYLHAMIGKVLIKLYETRKDHTFGKYVPVISKHFNESLNEISTFLHNLRLSEIGQIALNYMNTKANFDPKNEEHYYLLWKIGDLIEDKKVKEQVQHAYISKFPNGTYTNIFLTN